MRVDRGGQTVMPELLLGHGSAAEVQRLHHAPRTQDPQHGVEVWVGRDHGSLEGFRQGFPAPHAQLEAL